MWASRGQTKNLWATKGQTILGYTGSLSADSSRKAQSDVFRQTQCDSGPYSEFDPACLTQWLNQHQTGAGTCTGTALHSHLWITIYVYSRPCDLATWSTWSQWASLAVAGLVHSHWSGLAVTVYGPWARFGCAGVQSWGKLGWTGAVMFAYFLNVEGWISRHLLFCNPDKQSCQQWRSRHRQMFEKDISKIVTGRCHSNSHHWQSSPS